MNKFSSYIHKTPKGWFAFLRMARDSHARPLIGKGDQPKLFTNELEAERAINRHLLAYLNGDYRHSSENSILNEARRRAENLFCRKEAGHDSIRD